MSRLPSLVWFFLFLLLLPTAAGRFLLDLAGGVVVVLFAISCLVAGLGWLGWRVLQSRMRTCEACGVVSMGGSDHCPICGAGLSDKHGQGYTSPIENPSMPASATTVDVVAKDVDADS